MLSNIIPNDCTMGLYCVYRGSSLNFVMRGKKNHSDSPDSWPTLMKLGWQLQKKKKRERGRVWILYLLYNIILRYYRCILQNNF